MQLIEISNVFNLLVISKVYLKLKLGVYLFKHLFYFLESRNFLTRPNLFCILALYFCIHDANSLLVANR